MTARWDDFVDATQDDAAPTHRVRVTVDIDLTMILPPWVNEDDALTEILMAIGDLDIDYRICEGWSYDDPEIVNLSGGVTGSTGSIEHIGQQIRMQMDRAVHDGCEQTW